MPYSSGTIHIPNVNGNIAITVETEAIFREVANLFVPSQAQLNKRWSSSSITDENGAFITNELTVQAGDEIYLKNCFGGSSVYLESDPVKQKLVALDASSTKVGAKLLAAAGSSNIILTISGNVGHFTVPDISGMTKMVLSLLANTNSAPISVSDLSNVILTKNQPLT